MVLWDSSLADATWVVYVCLPQIKTQHLASERVFAESREGTLSNSHSSSGALLNIDVQLQTIYLRFQGGNLPRSYISQQDISA